MSDLIKVSGQVGPKLDHQVPPDLHLGKQEGLCPNMDGHEGLHQELHTFSSAEDVLERIRKYVYTRAQQHYIKYTRTEPMAHLD